MEALINKQKNTYDRIQKAYTNYKKSPKERVTRPYVKVRLQNLEEMWSQLTECHNKLYEESEPEKLNVSQYVKEKVYDLAEEIYMQYKIELETVIESFIAKEEKEKRLADVTGQSSKQCQVKLPKIVIPVFDGKYTEWVTFRDLFVSLIHNNSALDNVQRMQYLKGYLSGEAEQLLRQIPISEANYSHCWDQLNARYNNKRYLSHYILKRLLSQRNLHNESAVGLKELIDTTNDCLKALSNLGIDVSTWDIIVIHIITLKLDQESRKKWEFDITSQSSTDELPTLSQFTEFLTNRYRALELLDGKQGSGLKSQGYQSRSFSHPSKLHTLHVTNIQCPFCSEPHKLANCKQFVGADVNARRSFVREKGICFNCLGNNHSARICNNAVKCKICKRRHHSLLHPLGEGSASSVQANVGVCNESRLNKENLSTQELEVDNDEPLVSCFSTGKPKVTVLLATALIKAESRNGTYQLVRALVDQGSQASFVTEATVQYLGLKKTPSTQIIKGIGGDKETISRYTVTINIKSRIDSKFNISIRAYVLKSITSLLPVAKVTAVKWDDLREESLADPEYYSPNKINMLLGAEIYSHIIEEGLKRSLKESLVAQSTKLGWIISGPVENLAYCSSSVVVMHSQVDVNDILKRFWEIEAEPTNQKTILTEDERRCEALFSATTVRDLDGRYVVRLPFREEETLTRLTGSMEVADRRLKSLHARLKRNPELKASYKSVLNDYIEQGHMEKVPENEKDKLNAIYLPHHAVVRNDKDTTKVRVVFDASCKNSKGYSLNDNLLIGPKLQPELRHLLIRWRSYPVCLAADIVKMYRQVKVSKDDADYQRILWKEELDQNTEHYRLLTVTFGTASAPYLAVKALQQVAQDERSQYPIAADKVVNDFYMDDLLTGCYSIHDGLIIYKEMNALLSKAGFKLQKWMSNKEDLLSGMKEFSKGKEDFSEGFQVKEDEIVKLLGLTWNRLSDNFQYSVTFPPESGPVTKRSILSQIARLYDPLGWVAPCVIIAKIIIQKLWIEGLGWDEQVSSSLQKEWDTYRKHLPLLAQIKIPRWYGTQSENTLVELHGFADASKLAYAAAVYIRTIDTTGNVHVALVTSKTKVAPIKQVSIPRLELCGAVMLTRLLIEVATVMKVDMAKVRAYTDSTVVLAWLSDHPNRWKTFVANRVSEILTSLDPGQWSHVASKDNPADLGSRGVSPSELEQCSLWYNGPDFLSRQVVPYVKPIQLCTNIERSHVHFITSEDSLFNKYSSLSRLIRVVAYCRRFLKLRKADNSNQYKGYLRSEELAEALDCAIRNVQIDSFNLEIASLKTQDGFKRLRGPLKSLNPFLDKNNILRVGGRLEHSNLSQNMKHPILIPKKSHLTDLIVSDAHARTLHGGPQLMLSFLTTRYYIIGAKFLVKAHVRKCVTCVKNLAKSFNQLMGQLPDTRARPSRPFKCCGVDYAGPINIRTSRGRGHHSQKGYICLFICMATRAVHIEVVSDLTSQGFLAAFRRFVARRGLCTDIYSDNGTNFVGAAKDLPNLLQSENSSLAKDIFQTLATIGTTWHFIPPRAPNFGGLWEAGIKSVKFHLKRVIGDSTLTYEELSTVLVQIEACLNSRPLSTLNSEADALDVLTPGHFLIGEPLITAPDHNYEVSTVSNLRRWHLTQKMMQNFWRRWSQEYLTVFLHRYKWACQLVEPKIGDVVVVKEDDLPPSKWLLGRIVEKHPGKDNITRVVTLRTKTSFIKRPTSKLSILPVAQ